MTNSISTSKSITETPPETENLINDMIPNEVILMVFGKLRPQDQKTVPVVCKLWNELGNTEKLWVNLAEDRFQNDEYNFQDKWVVQLTHKTCDRNTEHVTGLPENLGAIAEMAPSVEKCHEEFMERVGNALLGQLILIASFPIPGAQLEMELPEFPCLEGYMNTPKYSFVYGNQGEVKKDPLVALQLYLIKALESTNKEVRESAVKVFRKMALDFVHHGKLSTSNGSNYVYNSILRSLLWGYLGTSPDLKKAAKEAVEIFQKNHLLMQDLARGMPSGEIKSALFKAICGYCTKFSKFVGEQIDWKQSILCISHPRLLHAQNLGGLVESLRVISFCSSFENNFEEHIKVAVRGLIALSQKNAETFTETSTYRGIMPPPVRYFQSLENYLGQANYDYVLNNDQQATSKLRKAAVLYIIRGLESENPEVKNAALKGLGILANDYLKYGHNGEAAEEYLAAIFEIARGYITAEVDEKTMLENIISIFQSNIVVLEKFVTVLPGGVKKDAFAEAIVKLKEID